MRGRRTRMPPARGQGPGGRLRRRRCQEISCAIEDCSRYSSGSRAGSLQERLTMIPVAQGLGSSGAGRGKRGNGIAVFQALLQVGSQNEFMKEAGVETVARSNRIHRLNRQGRRMEL